MCFVPNGVLDQIRMTFTMACTNGFKHLNDVWSKTFEKSDQLAFFGNICLGKI